MRKVILPLLLLVLLMSIAAPSVSAAASLAPHTAAAPSGATRINAGNITIHDSPIAQLEKKRKPSARQGATLPVAKGPAVALLQTVPSVPGITFQIAGQQYVSGPDGSVAITVPQAGTYDLQVITDTFRDPYRRVEFSRWLGESFEPTRQIHIPSKDVVQVGLNVYMLVGEKFVDLQGKPVDPKRVTQFSIRSIQGDAFTFKDGQPRWLPASRVTRRRTGGLQEVPLLYTITEALIDGSNVVNKAQQQFYASPNGVWTIALLLYNLHVTTQDAIFGFPQGTSVQLQYPNGRLVNYPVDKSGVAQMYSLPRGDYMFQVLGAPGIAPRAPIALSKDQTLSTKVISYLDLVFVGCLGLLVALGLFVYGRLSLRRSHRRLEQQAAGRVHIMDNHGS